MNNDYIKVSTVDKFEEGTVKGFRVAGQDVAVVTWGGRWFAFRNVCTHSAYSFDYLCVDEDGTLTCGAHGAQFVVETGEAIGGPTRTALPTFSARVEGDDVLVSVSTGA
jgi:3-phenylpropionate/trans-cinnamate dioxygenase ferredoxin subunit